MSLALNAIDLKKNYNGVPVVNGVSFQINPGECVGIFGPQDSGKSTIIKMICGQVKASSGELMVLGLNTKNDIFEIRSRLGIILEEQSLDTDFSALENLLLFARYHNMDSDLAAAQVDHLLSEMKLTEFKHKSINQLSVSLKHRLTVARALINKPQMLLMDEPTQGLDPEARNWIWNYFEKIKANNITLILGTCSRVEAERLCDRVILIDHGILLDHGSVKELIHKHIGEEVIELSIDEDKNYWINKITQSDLKYQEYEKSLFIFFKNKNDRQNFISLIQNTHYHLRSAHLNDVFLKLAGYQIKDNSIRF